MFKQEINTGLIKRAVLSIQSNSRQPQGTKKKAGRNNTAEYRAIRALPIFERTINTDRARLPRLKNRRTLLAGRVASVPQAVGGPRVRTPKTEKKIKEKINKKEKKKAFYSALAATTNKELVLKRHNITKKIPLPIIIEDKFEEIKKTKKVKETLKNLGLYEDVLNAKKKRKIRAGKGKKRGRKYKKKKSILIVSSKQSSLLKAAANLEGVDTTTIQKLNVEHLAPGTMPGRLAIFTESTLKWLSEKKWKHLEKTFCCTHL